MPAAAELPAPRSVPRAYARHRPETTTLYEVVRDNLETLYGAIDDGGLAVRVPKHAKKELEAYLSCGVLCRGFARLRCGSCADSLLVAFSCKGRGFCPSCIGRRMCATAANMIEHVLPREAALRQWVLTFPFPWRVVLARDGALLGALTRIFLESVQTFYAKRADAPGGKTGAFTVIQRTSSDVRLHPHLHALVLDGVYREEGSALVWWPTRHLQTRQVGEVLEHAVRRMARYLRRRHLLEAGENDDQSNHDAEGRLEASAVSGQTPPAGPSWFRGLPPQRHRALGYDKPLCASLDGFSLHAATRAGGHDAAAKEALLRYVLRPPVGQERVELRNDGLVRIVLKRPFADGTLAVDMDPLSLLARLAACVPPPRFHTVRYAGVLASASRWRKRIAPEPPAVPAPALAPAPGTDNVPPKRAGFYRPWAELLKRTFGFDVLACKRCGGRLRLLAMVTEPASVVRYLARIGETTDVPVRSPSRGPPYWKSTVLRRKVLGADA